VSTHWWLPKTQARSTSSRAKIHLPWIGGPRVAALIRSSRPELKVLLMSASPVPEGWDYLRKPFMPEELVMKVRRILA
jgi:DNA-binding response OmpR family regulator